MIKSGKINKKYLYYNYNINTINLLHKTSNYIF